MNSFLQTGRAGAVGSVGGRGGVSAVLRATLPAHFEARRHILPGSSQQGAVIIIYRFLSIRIHASII